MTRIGIVIRSLGVTLLLFLAAGCSNEYGNPQPRDNGPTQGLATSAATDPELSDLALRAQTVLSQLATQPDSSELREELLSVFNDIYREEWGAISPDTHFIYGDVLVAGQSYAVAGDQPFLMAIVEASFGPYGQTAEGSGWLNELLWENLETDPQSTVNVLGELQPEHRALLIKNEYTKPVHDGFDFARIEAGLVSAQVPEGLREEVQRITETARAHNTSQTVAASR